MGWFRKSKSKQIDQVAKKDLWTICPGCKAHIFKEEWAANINVCPQCNFHDRITCGKRIEMIIDEGTFSELFKDVSTSDPLGFVDAKGPYSEKAKATKEKLNMTESVITGHGNINDMAVVVSVMDFRFLGGSLGSGTGEKILRGANYALKNKIPYIVFSASGGARMHEGIISLMQMAKTCAGIGRLNKAGIPYVSVITHPTTGGVSASYAMVGDINIAEPGVLIGFAGRRVIEETIKQKLPDDFQTAEYVMEHGFIDHIVERQDMKDFLHRVLKYWNN